MRSVHVKLQLATLIAIPTETRFYGVGGEISVWNPAVSRTEDYSASAVIVRLREGAYFMAGWIVSSSSTKQEMKIMCMLIQF